MEGFTFPAARVECLRLLSCSVCVFVYLDSFVGTVRVVLW